MNPELNELKNMIEETRVLAEKNNSILRAIRRDQWIGFFYKVIIWIIVLGAPLYFYQYYLQPLVLKFQAVSEKAPPGTTILPTSFDINKLLNSIKMGE